MSTLRHPKNVTRSFNLERHLSFKKYLALCLSLATCSLAAVGHAQEIPLGNSATGDKGVKEMNHQQTGKQTQISMAEIRVTGIEQERGGKLIVFILAEEGFPKKHDLALQRQVRKVSGREMTFEFPIVQQELAIKVLHDEDEDGKVTKNWTGIYPAEGLGFSNKQKVTLSGAQPMSARKFWAAKFFLA